MIAIKMFCLIVCINRLPGRLNIIIAQWLKYCRFLNYFINTQDTVCFKLIYNHNTNTFFSLKIWSWGSKTKGNKSRYLPGHVIPAPPHRPGPRPSRRTWASCWPSPENPRLCQKILAATIEQSFVKKFLL